MTEKQDPRAARQERVAALEAMVLEDLKRWDYAYSRIRFWRKFSRGQQWPGQTPEDASNPDRAYVANVTMRHLKQRTAAIYAKNPQFQWRKSKRIDSVVWDGTNAQLQLAQQQFADAQMTGSTPAPIWGEILQEAIQVKSDARRRARIGETLTLLYTYQMREQSPPTKKMMKKQVLSALTSGAAFFKQTFQRATDLSPDQKNLRSSYMQQLSEIERLASEMSEGEIGPDDAEIERLQEMIGAIEASPEIVLQEGLAIDYPDAVNIIPAKSMTYLPGFVGCGHVTEQYFLSCEEIERIYGKDVKGSYKGYVRKSRGDEERTISSESEKKDASVARVWEIWNRDEGTVCVICEGHNDYLVEPHAPTTYTDRFYPWFVFAPNAMDDDGDPWPPSDVELMMSQQAEINRAGEALRDHRWAARPGWVTGSNVPEQDRQAMQSRAAHAITTLGSLGPDEDIRKKFQEFPRSPIDPNLYNTGPAFEDILRSVGTQEANLGGVGGGTATESSIAEASRQSTLDSTVDEFDDLLTEMARAGGQILLQEMSADKVREIVGPGAIWPEATRTQIAQEIMLEVVAGSSGKPNQAARMAVIERAYPLMFQIPNLSHEKMARHAVLTIDDGADFDEWLDDSALPVTAMNGQMQANANRGVGNAPKPDMPGGRQGMPGPGQAGMGAPQPPKSPPQ